MNSNLILAQIFVSDLFRRNISVVDQVSMDLSTPMDSLDKFEKKIILYSLCIPTPTSTIHIVTLFVVYMLILAGAGYLKFIV